MNIRLYADLIRSSLLAERKAIIRQLSSLPEGKLQIHRNASRCKWFRIYKNGKKVVKKTYIPKSDRMLAEQLADKARLEAQLSIIDKKLCILEQFITEYPDTGNPAFHSASMTDEYNDLLRSAGDTGSSDIETWLSEEFEHCPEHTEFLKVPTKAGILVRSKSEALIADELYDQGVPFRYEQAMYLGDMKIYPDFIIPDPNCLQNIKIWEHFGLMDMPSYVNNAKIKLGAYLESKYIPGQNLILTYESKDTPLDINYVSLLVAYHFS